MLNKKALAASLSAAAQPLYVEDVFSTYLYTGNGSTQTITNNIDLSSEGGLVWIKSRGTNYSNLLADTVRGNTKYLLSNTTDAETTISTAITSFNSNGFSLSSNGNVNDNTDKLASWTFRKAKKFFDVVTYTGNGSSSRAISHNLNGTPGCVIVKRTDTSGGRWAVWHRSTGNDQVLYLDLTQAVVSDTTKVRSATSTTFTVGNDFDVNSNNGSYVAYIFAHDAGGFGDSGSDNVITCGSFTTDGSGNATVNLGYEPQWVLRKITDAASDWAVIDVTRRMDTSAASGLTPNTTDVEGTASYTMVPTATGFTMTSGPASLNFIYIAIRRGPMKTPEAGTEVFEPVAYTGTNVDNRLVNTGILTDMTMARIRTATSTGSFYVANRLTGVASLGTALTAAENTDADSFMTPTVGYGSAFSAMNGFGVGNDVTRQLNGSSTSQLAYAFKRAPGFFDTVCYTGTGSNRTVSHNLGVVPEFMFVKQRSNSGTGWMTYHKDIGNTKYVNLNTTAAAAVLSTAWNNTTPTSSVFSLGTDATGNKNNETYVWSGFASVTGVSKVGSYTGTGTTLQINCGFTGGARFVLIKRTDSTGDWYVWDTARGIVSGNDPYLLLNSTAAEVTNTDYIDTYSSGFEISSAAPAAINANGGTFIFLAIA